MAKKIKKILTAVICAILVLAVAAVAAAGVMFRRELATILSIDKLDDGFYTMDFTADYGLDAFLEQGASTDAELAAFVVQNLMKGLPVEIELPDFGCSTFMAETPDGDVVFGRNFDNPEAVYALVHTAPENGYESISMVNLGYIGYGDGYLPESLAESLLALAAPYIPLDGVNEAGLAIGVLQLSMEPTHQDNGKPDITTTSAIRMMLDKCATVDEAIALLGQYDMHSSANAPYHFQIADANGDTATVEYLDGEMSVYRETDGSLCTTNFVLTPGAYFNDGKGQDRWNILREGLAATDGIVTEEGAMDLLQAAAQIPEDEDDGYTLWSCVYNNTDRTLTLCRDLDYETVYHYSVSWE